MKYDEGKTYWDKAGEISYADAMFSNSEVEHHVNRRLWQIGVDIGKQLGLNEESYILDLGCGDGALSNLVLSKHFNRIDGFDLSVPAVARANELAPHKNIRFKACDITTMDFSELPKYDGVYLWGILHHIKEATPSILKNLHRISSRIIVLEPNGNHILRKLLERTKAYKAAGEDSFGTIEMEKLFHRAGFHCAVRKRLNLFPNFTPILVFRILKHLEPLIEKLPVLRAMCTVNMWGFERL